MPHALRFPPEVPELFEESLHLRELTEQDIPAWFKRATDIESADLAGDPVPESIDAGGPWLHRQRDLFRQRAGIRWAIDSTAFPVSVGTVSLTITSEGQRTADLGMVLARACWGQGIGTAVARMVTRYAFTALGLAEIQAEVLQRNPASIRLLEKSGFRLLRVKPATAVEPEELLLYVRSCDGGRNAV